MPPPTRCGTWTSTGTAAASPYKLRGDAIPILARIACLAQTADVFITQDGLDAAREMVRVRRGRWFDPAVADAFLGLPDSDPLFADLAMGHAAPAPAGGPVSADDAPRRPDRRGVRIDDRRKEPVHGQPLRAGGRLRRRHRPRARLGRAGAARPAPRRPPARHRQAGRVQLDPGQAREADRAPSTTRSSGIRATPRRSCATSRSSPGWPRRPPPTTSGATGAATTAASRATRSRRSAGCSPAPTSTTRSPPAGPTATRCRPPMRSRSCAREVGSAFFAEQFAALDAYVTALALAA